MATAPKTKTTADSRISRGASRSEVTQDRAPRSSADSARVGQDGTVLSAAERMQMLRSEFTQEALPNAPNIPGHHVCWLSSTSSYDPISKRQRLGYEPVLTSELPGFNTNKMASGEFAGVISCNEMLLFKIPLDMYDAIMHEFHHAQPLREEETLRANIDDQVANARDSKGRQLATVEGFDDLAVKRSAPNFAA